MKSEKKDFLTDNGVTWRTGKEFSAFYRTSFLKKSYKIHNLDNFDEQELIRRHNLVFGIDSSDPVACIRKDCRSKKSEGKTFVQSQPLPTDAKKETDSVANVKSTHADGEVPIYFVDKSVQPSIVTPTSTEAEIKQCGNYDSTSDVDRNLYIGKQNETIITPKEAEKKVEASISQLSLRIEEDARELSDVNSEEIADFAVQQMGGHDDAQDGIETVAVSEEEVNEPAVTVQTKLDVEFEQESEHAEVAAENSVTERIADAAASADAVSKIVESATVEEPAVIESTEVPAVEDNSEASFVVVAEEPDVSNGVTGMIIDAAASADAVSKIVEPAIAEDVESETSEVVAVVEPVSVATEPVEPSAEEPAIQAEEKRTSGITFLFGGAATKAATSGIRFVFGTASN